MSQGNMMKFIPVEASKWGEMVQATARVKELEAENARLKAEVERLKERNQFLEQIDSYLQSANLNAEEQRSIELEAQVERLTNAGDNLVYVVSDHFVSEPFVKAWFAAKKGGQP